MVSIKDIARALSISPASVSLVLNDKAKEKRISQALEAKVRKAAAQMGYHPNRAAVSLRTGRSKTIGLIVENIANEFFSSLAKVIEEEVRKLDYNVVYCSMENDVAKGREILQMLHQQQVDGYLITPAEGMQGDIAKLLEGNRPVVLMDRYLEGVDAPSVLVDNYQGMKCGLDYLIERGSRKIGLVTVDLDLFHMRERERAFHEAHRAHGLSYSPCQKLTLKYNCTREEAITVISRFIRKQSDLDALVFTTNYLGIYGLLCLKKLKLRIPGDRRILCFDDHAIFELYEPGITVIQQPIPRLARIAVEKLVTALGDAGGSSERVLLPTTLIVRGSI